MSLDGHDKLCGYQKDTFPLCVYGGLDTYSGRLNFLRIWYTNNDPVVIGRFYLEYLYESKGRYIIRDEPIKNVVVLGEGVVLGDRKNACKEKRFKTDACNKNVTKKEIASYPEKNYTHS